ncbi:E3 ubiquitin-protein ligase TRIM71 [Geodia barretti]|nr:E3 ubiquitin-protein ligase TRIM71 [Geodia barretti]
MDRELADVNHKLTQKEEELIGKQVQLTQTEAELTRAQEILKRQQQEMEEMMSPASYVSRVSGPGLISATVNKPTHLFVKLTQSSGRACTLQVDVTAQLDFVSQDRVAGKSSVRHKIDIPVVMKSPSQYEMSYTAQSRGQRKIHVHVNNIEIDGSPFTVTVYPDPSHLGRPVKIVTGLTKPFGIAFNNQQCMIVSELGGHQLTLFDTRGHKIMTFGTYGGNPEQMIYPTGVVTDRSDNVYVSSEHKLQKFNSSGVFIKGTGQMGKREGEFYDPCGATLYNNTLYVCDAHNHRIQVFDLDLNFVRSIGTYGNGSGQFDKPLDVKFDIAGNMYVADFGNERLQVMDADGNFISAFGQEGEGKLRGPSAVHIADMYVYVSDWRGDCINVYETSGNFITSFGKHGEKEGDFRAPYCITSCADGYIYVCDNGNYRVQIF